MLDFEEYKKLFPEARVLFLDQHITDRTELSERFLLDSINWETVPLAQWYIVKGIGILGLQRGIPGIMNICRKPNHKFSHTTLHAICAWSLGKLGSTAYEAILSLIEDSNEETRLCGIDALGELQDLRAVEILSSIILNEASIDQRIWAGLSISKLGADVLPDLQKLLELSQNEESKLVIIDAIIKIGGPRATEFIQNILETGDASQIRFILERLGKKIK